MGGVVIEHSEKEKYLGDWIHEKGCKTSISETVKARMNRLVSKGEEIIQVSETPMMNGNGNSLAAFKLYEAQVIPALLFNSESWIGLKDTHISDLKISRQICAKTPQTTTFHAQSHLTMGLQTTNDEVENR